MRRRRWGRQRCLNPRIDQLVADTIRLAGAMALGCDFKASASAPSFARRTRLKPAEAGARRGGYCASSGKSKGRGSEEWRARREEGPAAGVEGQKPDGRWSATYVDAVGLKDAPEPAILVTSFCTFRDVFCSHSRSSRLRSSCSCAHDNPRRAPTTYAFMQYQPHQREVPHSPPTISPS